MMGLIFLLLRMESAWKCRNLDNEIKPETVIAIKRKLAVTMNKDWAMLGGPQHSQKTIFISETEINIRKNFKNFKKFYLFIIDYDFLLKFYYLLKT